MDLKSKFVNKWTKIRLCPIRAFCVHHVTELFNEQSMCVIDWHLSNVYALYSYSPDNVQSTSAYAQSAGADS